MTGSSLPPQVVAFIKEHVRSLLQLEALLLVYESGERSRTAADLSAEMYVPVKALEGWLDEFAANGFCVHDEQGYRGPTDHGTYELLAEVSEAHVRRPVSVGRLIFGSARDDLVELSDAFRLRKDR